MPISRQAGQDRQRGPLGSAMIAPSVTSSRSRAGGTPVLGAAAARSAPAAPRRAGSRAETLTATGSRCPRARQAPHCRSACVEHAAVSGRISPVCSARGMNSPGGTSPRIGCCQRTSASTPSAPPRAQAHLGLVVQHQLVARRWRGAAPRPGPARAAVVVLRGGSRPAQPAPVALGRVHRDVGVPQQRRRRRRRVPGRPRCRCWPPTAARRPRLERRVQHRAGGARRPRRRRRRRRAGSTTANSSPPSRATVSARAARRQKRPAISRSTDRRWCPNVSLISLKRSRSSISRDTGRRCARPRRWPGSGGPNSTRLGRPVRGSCSAW